MNIYKILILSMLLLFGKHGFSQQNLKSYLEISAKNNPKLKVAFNNYMAAMEKVPQVGALPDPSVTFGYFVQPVETRVGSQDWKFSMSQSFPWFGLLSARKDVATEKAKAKFELFENAKSNLFFEVKTAYYNYYFIEKAIEITKKNIKILDVFKQLSLVKIEVGKASIVDELRVELELNDLENKLALLVDTKRVLQVQFNKLLNTKVSTSISVPKILWQEQLPIDKQAALNAIFSSNHELKSMDHKINVFVNQQKVAKKQGLPKFTIGMGYTIIGKNALSTASDNGKDAFLFPSIGIKIPLYRSKYKAMIKEATYLQAAENSKKEAKKNSITTIYEKTFKDFSDSDRRILLNKKQISIAKKVLDALITSYSTDSKNFEEVLRIEKQMLKYELAYQKALTDKNAAVAFVEYLLGK